MTGRVWDAFLSERDKKLLEAGWAKREPFGLGSRPAVLVIDNQRSLLGDGPLPLLEAVKDHPSRYGEEAWEALDVTAGVLAAARVAGVPVIYLLVGGPGMPTLFHKASHMTSGFSAGADDARPSERRANEIPAVIAPAASDTVIEKGGASAFFGTPLTSVLVGAGIDTVVVVGNSTSGCVRHTVLDAAALRYRVAVVEDCVFDRSQASHAINLFDMHQKYADIVDSAEILAYFDDLPGRQG